MPAPTVELEGQYLAVSTTAASKVVTLDYALPWHLVVFLASGSALSVLRVRYRTHEKAPWSPWEAIYKGLPPEGESISLVEASTLAQAIEVELTATATGVATLWLVGA